MFIMSAIWDIKLPNCENAEANSSVGTGTVAAVVIITGLVVVGTVAAVVVITGLVVVGKVAAVVIITRLVVVVVVTVVLEDNTALLV